MFAHQVIEDLKEVSPGRTDFYAIAANSLKQKLQNSIKFYVELDSIKAMPHSNIMSLFQDNESFLQKTNVDLSFVKLPYNICWFGMQAPVNHIPGIWLDKWGKPPSTQKLGFLCLADKKQKEMTVYVYHFVYERRICQLMPIAFSVLLDCDHFNVDYGIGVVHLKDEKELYHDSLLKENYNSDTAKWLNPTGLLIGEVGYLSLLFDILKLLNCKNITTEIIPAPDKLNKKRIKQGKQPLFSYHTLVIKPVGKRQESIPRHLWENRIHLQRGHFKTYTDEKPLFGHITGRFWWQPHVRGRNKDGVVMKDYKVEARA